MVIPDVNVLISAFNSGDQFHEASFAWLSERLVDPLEEVVVPDIIWVGFARICTHPTVFASPASIQSVTDFKDMVVSKPAYRFVSGLSYGIDPLFMVMALSAARGTHVTDAYIAAVALQLDATVATYDRDFRRFDGLKIVTPGQ